MDLPFDAVKGSRRDIARGFNAPESIDAGVAEPAGAVIGDGHLHVSHRGKTTDYVTSIAFNRTEDSGYVDYLASRFGSVFGIHPRFKLLDHSNELVLRSKGVTLFFNELGIPAGKKADRVRIPDCIVGNETLRSACIRGVFDTDFSLTFKAKGKQTHHYPVISLSSASKPLRDQLLAILRQMEFENIFPVDRERFTVKRTLAHEHELYISGTAELERWMSRIGTSNPRHETKYQLWRRFGACPPNTTLRQRLELLGSPHAMGRDWCAPFKNMKAQI